MKIAFVLFKGVTWLDVIGIYDPITRLKSLKYLPDLTWDFCAFTNEVSDNFGLSILPAKVNTSLADYDVVIVPGGLGTRVLQRDEDFLNWLRTAQNCQLKISVCTGSLLMGAAGFLNNKRATTHFDEYAALANYCKEVVKKRIVVDVDVITAGAVSSSIDLGLYLCEKWASAAAAAEIRKRMDYWG